MNSFYEITLTSLIILVIFGYLLKFTLFKPIVDAVIALFAYMIKALIGSGNGGGILGFVGSIVKGVFWVLYQILYGLWRIIAFLFNISVGDNLFGSARWMKGLPKWKFLNKNNDGLVIDGKKKIKKDTSFKHLAVIAPTGSGKSTCFVIPNLLSNTERTSFVITDPSGEIHNKTAGYLSNQGYQIKTINLGDPEQSLTYNPLARLSSVSDVKKLVDLLIESAFPNATGDTTFWNKGAAQVLSILIQCLLKEEEKYRNLANLRYLLNAFGADGLALKNFFARNADEILFTEIRGFISQESKTISGFCSTAKTTLDLYADDTLSRITAYDSLEIESLRKEKTALYIIVPEQDVGYYSSFISLLYSDLFKFAMRSDGLDIFFLMDEFGNLSKLPDFSKIITTLRKRNCSISLILQDVAQLKTVYGMNEAATILNGGCASRLFFPGLSHETCRDLSEILGTATVQVKEEGFSSGKRNKSTGRKLLTADEIRTLEPDKAIFVHGREHPIMLDITPYYKQRALLAKSNITPTYLDSSVLLPVEFIPLESTESIEIKDSD